MYLRYASKVSIKNIGKIDLLIRIADPFRQSPFHIVDKLAVNILLGTSCLDKNIFSMVRTKKVVPCNSKAASTLAPRITGTDVDVSIANASEATSATVLATKPQAELRVDKQA